MAESPSCLPSVSDMNTAFIEQECAIEEMIAVYNDKTPETLWVNGLNFPQETFKYGEGYIKNKYIFHGSPAPQEERGDLWSKIKQSESTDSGDHDACNPDCTIIEYGFEQKQYQPYELCLKTDPICLEDIKYKWQFTSQMDRIYENLTEISTGVKENWNRDTYLSFASIFPAIENMLDFPASAGEVPAAAALNVGTMSQGILDHVYSFWSRTARKYAIGTGGNGQPVFGLITSPETSNHLMLTDAARREDIRYVKPEYLFQGFGASTEYRNWAHYYDMALPRFKVNEANPNGLERVWPWGSPTATTIGNKWNIDKEYLNAPYELSILYIKDVFSNQVLPPISTVGGRTSFDAKDYNGSVHWLNIQEECLNPWGNKGHFRMRFQWAPKPGPTDHAIAIIHKRCDLNTQFIESCDPCNSVTDCVDGTPAGNVATESFTDLTDVLALTLDASLVCAPVLALTETVNVWFTDGYNVDAEITAFTDDADFSVTLPEGVDPDDHGGTYAVQCVS